MYYALRCEVFEYPPLLQEALQFFAKSHLYRVSRLINNAVGLPTKNEAEIRGKHSCKVGRVRVTVPELFEVDS